MGLARYSPQPFLWSAKVPSPCYLIDEARLLENCALLNYVQERTGGKILLALKAFAAFSVFPLLSRSFTGPLYGTCCSSLDAARLGREEFQGEVHV
ncbi:MAG: carboxynorspermidine decarboxylase, partial [Desulfovibrio sp.]|nr:carboxynorspermidine decarboxylase [Desulfovibrio sp.]